MATKKKRGLSDIIDMAVEVAHDVIEQAGKEACGWELYEKEEFTIWKGATVDQEFFMELVEPLLATAQQARGVIATTSASIVKLISKGHITSKEALQLLKLLRIKEEVELIEHNNKVQHELIDTLGGLNA